jgi:hypothetical protein
VVVLGDGMEQVEEKDVVVEAKEDVTQRLREVCLKQITVFPLAILRSQESVRLANL